MTLVFSRITALGRVSSRVRVTRYTSHSELGSALLNGVHAGSCARGMPSFRQLSTSASPEPSPNSATESLSQMKSVGFGLLALALVSGAAGIYLAIESKQDKDVAENREIVAGCPIVYLDLMDGDYQMGRLVIQLRADIVPRTAENFRQLCTHQNGYGYKTSPLLGAEKGRRFFGGDFYGSGRGSFSIYGDTFADENFALKHDGPGVVAMRSTGPNTNGSQFYVTFRRLPELDGRCVVVGHVIDGWHVLQAIEAAARSDGKFDLKRHDFRIGGCGELKEYKRKSGSDEDKQLEQALNTLAGGAVTTQR